MESVVFTFASLLFKLLEFAILAQCILSWVIRGNNPIMDMLNVITAPILTPCKMLQSKFFGEMQIDFSPLIAIVAISILRRIILV